MIKNILNYLLHFIRPKILIRYPYEKISLKNKNLFFGYFDLQPFNNKQDKILFTTIPSINSKFDDSYVGYYCLKKKKYNFIKKLQVNSWQLGVRSQWIDLDSCEYIIFNDLENNSLCTFFYSLREKKIKKKLDSSFFCFNENNKCFATIDFDILEKNRPGYGYSFNNTKFNNSIVIFDLDLNVKKIFKVNELKHFYSNSYFEKLYSTSYFNHLCFSPNGECLLFFHIWNINNKRYSNAFIYNLKNDSIFKIDNQSTSSHYCWLNNNRIILTCKIKNFFGYYQFDKFGKLISEINIDRTLGDGHPSVHPFNKDLIVHDTYENNLNEKNLFIFNMKKNISLNLGYFYDLKIYKGKYKSDLHPRWSRDGNKIIIDVSSSGSREIYIIDVKKYLKQ